MGWSRRRALSLGSLGAVAVAVALGGCSRRAGGRAPHLGSDDAGDRKPFPSPEQSVTLFQDGSRHLLEIGAWATAATKSAGVLRMPTGRLVAADPSWLPSWQRLGIAPYTVTVPPGDYPVTLAVVSWPGGRRVAAVKLTIRDSPVRAWEMALRPGQDLAVLAPGEAYNVGVDVATMAIFDGAALAAMAGRADEDPSFYEVDERDQTVEAVDAASGANLIAFSTGWGDGGYPVWIGRTDSGHVGCFLVDMAMLAPQPSTGGASAGRSPA